MSQRSEFETDIETRATDIPALGLVATHDNANDIAGAILRANNAGYEALVVTGCTGEIEALDFARQLGATVERTNAVEKREAVEELARVARCEGFPGVFFQENPARPIDFEASIAALQREETYVVDAELASAVQKTPDVLAAIPAYNEGATINTVVTETKEFANEVLVIDDGSTDGTVSEALAAGATVIEHETNRGYGGALKTAFREAKRSGANHLVILDGDGQHDPSDIPTLVEAQQEEDVEVVIGSRFTGEMQTALPLYRRIGLGVVNFLTNLSLGVVRPRSRVCDTQSGYRAYNRDAIESLAADRTLGDNMSASTDILYHAHDHDYQIQEVGTIIDYEVESGSTHSPVAHGLSLVSNILRTIERERPVSALGVPGFISAFIGIGIGYIAITNYIASGIFSLSLAMGSIFFILAGIFACFTAIILHSLSTHNPAAEA